MKYDDFGRPIYETAEEYNRAHRTAGSSHTYESPEGDAYKHNLIREMNRNQTAAQRHANRQGSKKAQNLILGLVVFAIAINLVIVFTMLHSVGLFSNGSYENYAEDWIEIEENEDYGEYLGDCSTPLPEGFETFTYEGQFFELPTTFDEVLNMGYVMEVEYDEETLVPSGYNEFADLVDASGKIFAMISVDNYTDDEIPLGKCTVEYFSISNPYLYDETQEAPEFEFCNGLTFESTYEDLEACLGVPYYHYEDHSEEGYYYDSYEWTYYGDYETHHVNIIFWNGEISDVSIQKSIDEEIY